jgi:hypothetical protein
MDSEKYQIGDHVIILRDTSQVVGKIEEFFTEDNITSIRYNDYYSPDRTSAGKQDHNSKQELYKTDEIEKAPMTHIKSKCEVLKFDFYIKKLLTQKEKKPTCQLDGNTFFVRQKYSVEIDHFAPDLPTTCYCDQIFNPDKNFIQCKKCKELIHLECFLLGETKKCFNSSCNNNIEEQMQTQGIKNPSEVMIGNKRRRENEEEENEKHYLNQSINNQSNVNVSLNKSSQNASLIVDFTNDLPLILDHISSNSANINSNSQNNMLFSATASASVNKNDDDKNLDSYPNLSEERKKYLFFLTEKIEKKNNAVNRNINNEEKSRRTIRDMIMNSLVRRVIKNKFKLFKKNLAVWSGRN